MIKLDEKKVEKIIKESKNSAEALIELYKEVIPDWDSVERIEGFPRVNQKTNDKINCMFLEAFNGDEVFLLLLNKGFGTDEKLEDWEVSLEDVIIKRNIKLS